MSLSLVLLIQAFLAASDSLLQFRKFPDRANSPFFAADLARLSHSKKSSKV
jgi:hypothetical protein